MKRLILRLLVAFLTFVFSFAVTWLTAYFSDEPPHNETKAILSGYFSEEPPRNEMKAIRHLREICTAQSQYLVTKGGGNFTDLETLGKEDLIDKALASGEKDGYIFTSKPLPKSTNFPSMFDISASPTSVIKGTEAFYSNETYVIYVQKGIEPITATASDRVPDNGFPLQ
jgi:hypothetical protein